MTRTADNATSPNRSFGSSDRRFGSVRDLFHQQAAAFVEPHRLVQKHRHTSRDKQAICVEGPTADRYQTNEGARKIYEALRTRLARCTFHEPVGKHGDPIPERLERGLAWVFGRL